MPEDTLFDGKKVSNRLTRRRRTNRTVYLLHHQVLCDRHLYHAYWQEGTQIACRVPVTANPLVQTIGRERRFGTAASRSTFPTKRSSGLHMREAVSFPTDCWYQSM